MEVSLPAARLQRVKLFFIKIRSFFMNSIAHMAVKPFECTCLYRMRLSGLMPIFETLRLRDKPEIVDFIAVISDYISLRQWALRPAVCPAHESEDFFYCNTFLCWVASASPNFSSARNEFI